MSTPAASRMCRCVPTPLQVVRYWLSFTVIFISLNKLDRSLMGSLCDRSLLRDMDCTF